MNKFTIEWSEKKQIPSGKWVINATLKDEVGVTHERVSIWSDFPNWVNIMTGHTVEGNIVTNDKGYKTLYPPRTGTVSSNGGANRASGGGLGAGMMKAKSESIAKAQENKELGIMTSSTIRLATDCAIAENNPTPANILKWRNWFITNWDIEEPKSPVDINEPPKI